MKIISNIQELNNIRINNKNEFILCDTASTINIISNIFSVEFADSICTNLPFILRIGRGKIKEVIFKNEWPDNFNCYSKILLEDNSI